MRRLKAGRRARPQRAFRSPPSVRPNPIRSPTIGRLIFCAVCLGSLDRSGEKTRRLHVAPPFAPSCVKCEDGREGEGRPLHSALCSLFKSLSSTLRGRPSGLSFSKSICAKEVPLKSADGERRRMRGRGWISRSDEEGENDADKVSSSSRSYFFPPFLLFPLWCFIFRRKSLVRAMRKSVGGEGGREDGQRGHFSC